MSIHNVKRALVMALLGGLVFAGQALATPIVSISPSSQTVNVGDKVTVDILVSNLGATESVGGVSLFLAFNPSIIEGVDFTNDPDGDMGFALNPVLNDFGSAFGAGGTSPLSLFFLADVSLDGTALKALQGNGFRLANVNFSAIGAGLSGLTLSVQPTVGTFLSDADGEELPASASNGSVCVVEPASTAPAEGCTTAPEPVTLALLGSGLTAMVVRRRRQKAQAPVA